MRTFIAIDLTTGLKASVEALVGELQLIPDSRNVRWVGTAGMHLTLKFLGEITEEQSARVSSVLERIVPRHQPFELVLEKTGAFPPGRRNPRVLWVGVVPSPPLQALQEDIEAEMEKLGFPREERRFHPHLTIGRVKFPARLDLLMREMDKHREQMFGEMRVDKFILFQSILRPSGAVYNILKEFGLA